MTVLARVACQDHFTDCRIAWQFAFMRTMAVPRMASVLASTGQMQNHTQRRAYDTGLMMFEIISDPDGPGAKLLIKKINAMHSRPDIHAEDMVWILTLLGTLPPQRIARWSPRPLPQDTIDQCWKDWVAIGKRLNIADAPPTHAEALIFRQAYERTNLVDQNPEGAKLMEATAQVLADRMPNALRPVAPWILAFGVDDPRTSQVLGLPQISPGILNAAAFSSRNLRRLSKSREPKTFTPGMPSRLYPQGYRPEDLGTIKS